MKYHSCFHVNPGKKPDDCKKCGRSFNQRFHLKRHEINKCIKQKSGPKKPWKNIKSNGSQSNKTTMKNVPDEEKSNLKGEGKIDLTQNKTCSKYS